MTTFLDCPADGDLESAMIRCPVGHWFNGPIAFLSLSQRPERETRRVTA